nr:hypothetical protein [Tanacetum cinerariifolium]
MDLFAFINHADPTKVRIGGKKIEERKTPLLESTRGRVVPLAGVNEQGNQNDDVQNAGAHVVQDEGVNIFADDEVEATVSNKPNGTKKKRKTASGASSYVLHLKRLREDHDTSGDAGASTVGKSLVHESGGRTEFIFGPNLRTRHPAERFVISSDSSHHSSTNAADDEVTSIVRSPAPPHPVMTAAIATTAIASVISASVLEVGTEPARRSLFRDSASPSTAEANIVGPSQPTGAEVSADTFYVSQDMDSETLQHVYAPQWSGMDYKQLFAEFNVGVARQVCLSAEVMLRSEHNYREMKKFERKCNRQADLLKKKDIEIANLKAQLSLKEAEAAEVIRLRSRVAVIEATEAARILGDKVVGLDVELMRMDLHLDEEIYPRFLTTIVRRRWILGRGLRLVVMKCLQSLEYLAALEGSTSRVIDKGMQDGLIAGIDHGKAGRGLVDVDAYNPSAEANYVSAMNALRVVDFPLLARLESQKDASIADIMGLLHLEGSVAETLKASQLQPSHEQLMLPIHQTEDQVVIGETFLSFSLDIVHARVQRIR